MVAEKASQPGPSVFRSRPSCSRGPLVRGDNLAVTFQSPTQRRTARGLQGNSSICSVKGSVVAEAAPTPRRVSRRTVLANLTSLMPRSSRRAEEAGANWKDDYGAKPDQCETPRGHPERRK